MGKAVVFVLGVTVGAVGMAAWLASEPEAGSQPSASEGTTPLQLRLQLLAERFNRARAEGDRAGDYTEEHLRRKLDAYRKGSNTDTPA